LAVGVQYLANIQRRKERYEMETIDDDIMLCLL
jgi:hypothetical protein